MGFFDIFKGRDINQGLEEYRQSAGALLLDVRTEGEYSEGRIPGSRNLPLSDIDGIKALSNDMSTPLFVYCLSGARSSQASAALKRMGYQNVKNIGGINGYRGKVEH